jgi:hypothetical protein
MVDSKIEPKRILYNGMDHYSGYAENPANNDPATDMARACQTALDSFPVELSNRVKTFCQFQNRDNPVLPGILSGVRPVMPDKKIDLLKYLDLIGFSAEPVMDSYHSLYWNNKTYNIEDIRQGVTINQLMCLLLHMRDQHPPLLRTNTFYLLAEFCFNDLSWDANRFRNTLTGVLCDHLQAYGSRHNTRGTPRAFYQDEKKQVSARAQRAAARARPDATQPSRKKRKR